jgi:hypothetical protein
MPRPLAQPIPIARWEKDNTGIWCRRRCCVIASFAEQHPVLLSVILVLLMLALHVAAERIGRGADDGNA